MIRALGIFALALLASPASAHDQLVAPGATWKYRDNGTQPSNPWKGLGYNDSAWSSGPAQLGYGDGDEQTVVSYGPSSSNKYITTYFRKSFNVANPASYQSLHIRLLRDDGAAVYVNGVEVVRSNLDPNTTPQYSSLALDGISGEHEDAFWNFYAPASMLVAGANIIAVEIHQSAVDSSDISFDLELIGNTTDVLARGPYLQLATPNSVVVRWRTSHACASRVAYGSSPTQLTTILDDPTPLIEHEITVPALTADTRYYYSVGSPSVLLAPGDANQFFTTAPAPGSTQPFRVWVIGDAGTGDANQRNVRDAYATWTGTTATSLWLMLGDNAYPLGFDEDYQRGHFGIYGAMQRKSPLWPTRGNHETVPGVYYGSFSMPDNGQAGGLASGTEAYYSFDWGNAHFVCLDSEGSSRVVGGAMYNWLQADLSSNAQEWLIAYWHHPPYTKGSHDSDVESHLVEMRENFLPLLEANGVDLVLGGHSHDYERSYLIDGHYDVSSTFISSMKLDGGSGNPANDGAYNKADGAHRGTVYCVAGSSGKIETDGTLDHPVMHVNLFRLGSVALDIAGGRLEASFIDSTGAVADRFVMLHPSYAGTYCKAKLDSQGCTPAIGSSGAASATNPAPFTISCANVIPGRAGILLYGFTPANSAFSGGKLCIGTPIQRFQRQVSTGAGACGGVFAADFNARIQSGADPALAVGVTVDAQYWYRDPPASFGTGLSDALQFCIAP